MVFCEMKPFIKKRAYKRRKQFLPKMKGVQWIEESFFFKLSEWDEKLLKYFDENPDFIVAEKE